MASRAARVIRRIAGRPWARGAFAALMLMIAALPVLRWWALSIPPPLHEIFPHGALIVGVDGSYPPFASVNAAGELVGIDIDVARALGERMGLPVQFVNMGFDGLYDSLRAGQVDVVIAALTIDPQRTADVYYSWAYYNAGLMLVSDAGSGIESMHDISGRRLAYAFGSSADAEVRAWSRRIAPFERRPYETSQAALDAARLGEVDAALIDATSARQYVSAHPAWAAQTHYVTDVLYSAASDRKRTWVWRMINTAMLDLINDGTLDAIIARG